MTPDKNMTILKRVSDIDWVRCSGHKHCRVYDCKHRARHPRTALCHQKCNRVEDGGVVGAKCEEVE